MPIRPYQLVGGVRTAVLAFAAYDSIASRSRDRRPRAFFSLIVSQQVVVDLIDFGVMMRTAAQLLLVGVPEAALDLVQPGPRLEHLLPGVVNLSLRHAVVNGTFP